MYNWKVLAQQEMGSESIRLYVFRKMDGYTEFTTKGGTERQTVKASDPRDADKLWFGEFPNTEVAGLVLEAVQKIGVPLPSKDYTAGKLEATERHLEDLHQLVFKEKK